MVSNERRRLRISACQLCEMSSLRNTVVSLRFSVGGQVKSPYIGRRSPGLLDINAARPGLGFDRHSAAVDFAADFLVALRALLGDRGAD